jgi:hypothetical protein
MRFISMALSFDKYNMEFRGTDRAAGRACCNDLLFSIYQVPGREKIAIVDSQSQTL